MKFSMNFYVCLEFLSFIIFYYISRVCKLYFHLEDDSLAVVEQSEENSGMTQGRIVRRHQVPFKEIDPDAGGHFIFLFSLNNF